MSAARFRFTATGRYADGRTSGAYYVSANGRSLGLVSRTGARTWVAKPEVGSLTSGFATRDEAARWLGEHAQEVAADTHTLEVALRITYDVAAYATAYGLGSEDVADDAAAHLPNVARMAALAAVRSLGVGGLVTEGAASGVGLGAQTARPRGERA